MDAQYVPVESEHSALAVCIAASSAGARAFTATSANGLLYMHEQVHWAAGARLPIVMCVANRAVGAPWNIWNDHQDSISQRDTGWIQIYSCDHQQIIDDTSQGLPRGGGHQHPGDGVLRRLPPLAHLHALRGPGAGEGGAVPAAVPAVLRAGSGLSGQPQHRHAARGPPGRARRAGPRLHGDPLPAAGGPAQRRAGGRGDRRRLPGDLRARRSAARGAVPLRRRRVHRRRHGVAHLPAAGRGRDAARPRGTGSACSACGSTGRSRTPPSRPRCRARAACSSWRRRCRTATRARSARTSSPPCTTTSPDKSAAPFVKGLIAGIGGREIRTADLADALRSGLAGSIPEPNWIGIQL